jgi:membrane dipeptidase
MDWQTKYRELTSRNHLAGKKPVVGITANFGEYGSQLAEAYYESVRLAGGVPVILPASLETEDLDDFLQKVDAMLFSGGGDINPLMLGEEPVKNLHSICAKRDLQELILMRRALDKQIPVLGICRGVQVLAAAQGGKIVQDIYTSGMYDKPLLKHSQDLDRQFASHTVRIEKDSILYTLFGTETVEVNSFHHQAVSDPGHGMKVTAVSPDGVVEAIESTEFKSVLGVQWHPESFYVHKDNPMSCIFEWLVGESREYREARRLHSRILTLDSHCDTPMFFDQDIDFSKRDDRILVDATKMRDGGLDASIMAAYLPQGERDEESLRKATLKAHSLLDGIDSRIASVDGVGLATTPAEVRALKAQGKLAIMKGIENGYAIGRDLHNLEEFKKRGVVYITLCHNGDNNVCDSAVKTRSEHGGLSEFGRKVVKEMNRLGIMVDLSHASAASFYDAMATSSLPIVCSHASCKAICNHPRNLDDEQMKALSHNGGVMQITLYHGFLRTDGKATILDAVEHLNHAVDVMGIDHVGIGTDFDGDGGVPGFANASETINFTRQLLKSRYSEDDIAKLWGGNFLRVMAQVQDAAEGER